MANDSQEKVWDAVAEQWKHFRQKPFSELSKTINRLANNEKNPEKAKIFEIGCGNCRNLLEFGKRGFKCYGIDFSSEMLKQADYFSRKNNFRVILKKIGATKLKFKKDFFDYVLCIAVLHHLNKKEQGECLNEIYRILKKRGKLLITVWNKSKWNFLKKSKQKEIFVPWTIKGRKYLRYYYLFSYTELERLIKKIGFEIIGKKQGKNIIFVCEK
jgi:ubiquinone/menaquinone biosynthesis C-methylase UbiE